MSIKALTFDSANNIESRNDAYWYDFITKSICGKSVGIIKHDKSMEPHQNENVITFEHGYINIYGRLIEVEQGTQLTIPFAEMGKTVSGSVIIKINLQNQPGNQVFLTTTTKDLVKNDLTKTNNTGVYEFLIGTYEATDSSIKNWQDKREYISSDYTKNKVNEVESKINTEKIELIQLIKIMELKKTSEQKYKKIVVNLD